MRPIALGNKIGITFERGSDARLVDKWGSATLETYCLALCLMDFHLRHQGLRERKTKEDKTILTRILSGICIHR